MNPTLATNMIGAFTGNPSPKVTKFSETVEGMGQLGNAGKIHVAKLAASSTSAGQINADLRDAKSMDMRRVFEKNTDGTAVDTGEDVYVVFSALDNGQEKTLTVTGWVADMPAV